MKNNVQNNGIVILMKQNLGNSYAYNITLISMIIFDKILLLLPPPLPPEFLVEYQ